MQNANMVRMATRGFSSIDEINNLSVTSQQRMKGMAQQPSVPVPLRAAQNAAPSGG